ncbi:hypothetical protein FJZ31_19110 [Candidatus Poribacteria bacterium]|nr:hypothetical protein [Candidatus Poribacteria bacterium]
MRKILPIAIAALCIVALSCVPTAFLAIDNSVDNLVNYALAKNGAIVEVSYDNPEHPASTLINGVTSSAGWDSGEGWALHYTRSIQKSCNVGGG